MYNDMYRVIYKGYSGGYTLSDEMTYGAAFEFKAWTDELKEQYADQFNYINQICELNGYSML